MFDFEEMRTKIYPWIKAAVQDDGADGGNEKEYTADMPMKQFLADLLIFFVADTGSHFEILQRHHLPDGMTIDELYDIAVDNLLNDVEFQLSPTNFGGYGILAGGDHEAGALCLDGLWEFCADTVGESLVVAVPAKDMVLMAGRSQTDAIEQMRKVSADIMADGERTLTAHLFLYDAEKKEFSVYE